VHSNGYTFRFAAMVTIVCSVLLASAATLLKPLQEQNERTDIQKNILASVGIVPQEGESFTKDKVADMYKKNIRELVINKAGSFIEGKTPADLDLKKLGDELPIYKHEVEGECQAYVIPISGKGLWSTIYGYLALDTDGATVKGITFYKHGETPGLGGEIDKTWFTDNFRGKRIVDDAGNLVSISVVKGKVKGLIPDEEAYHYVDGISGSTLTGRGVQEFLKADLKKYDPFFKSLRKTGGEQING